jgi:hypothetical protein
LHDGRYRARARARGLTTYIEDVCTFVQHTLRTFDCEIDRGETSAVGKAVRRYIENTHDQGAFVVSYTHTATPES